MDRRAVEKAPDPAVLSAVLSAREERWIRRMALAKDSASLLSATLCVPLPVRTSPEGKRLLRKTLQELEKKLKQAGFQPAAAEYMDGADGLAAFLPCGGEAEDLKRFCVREEEALPAGRLLDLDVTARGGRPIGRAELGLPPRRCFLCGRPAAECVSGQRHTQEGVLAYVRELLGKEIQE